MIIEINSRGLSVIDKTDELQQLGHLGFLCVEVHQVGFARLSSDQGHCYTQVCLRWMRFDPLNTSSPGGPCEFDDSLRPSGLDARQQSAGKTRAQNRDRHDLTFGLRQQGALEGEEDSSGCRQRVRLSSGHPNGTALIEISDINHRNRGRHSCFSLPVPDIQFRKDNMHLPNHLTRVRRL